MFKSDALNLGREMIRDNLQIHYAAQTIVVIHGSLP